MVDVVAKMADKAVKEGDAAAEMADEAAGMGDAVVEMGDDAAEMVDEAEKKRDEATGKADAAVGLPAEAASATCFGTAVPIFAGAVVIFATEAGIGTAAESNWSDSATCPPAEVARPDRHCRSGHGGQRVLQRSDLREGLRGPFFARSEWLRRLFRRGLAGTCGLAAKWVQQRGVAPPSSPDCRSGRGGIAE